MTDPSQTQRRKAVAFQTNLADSPRKGKRSWVRAAVWLTAAWAGLYYGLPLASPLPDSLALPPKPGTKITDLNGAPLRKLLQDGRRVDRPLDFSEIPPALVNAIVSAEDQRFWSHGGIDFLGMMRAGADSIGARRPVSGASTISQQVVKVAGGRYRNRTWRDKLYELAAARKLELTWSKERILTEYLQRVEFGNQCTGCRAAAEGYFHKPLADLSLAECAFLAALPQAPTRLNPYRNFEGAKRRQEWILQRIREDGKISGAEEKRAAAQPLRLRRWTGGFEAPHFVDMLLTSPELSFAVESEETVRTSLDLELQHFCERALKDHVQRLREHNVHNAALVVLDNSTGGIRALVGSQDYFASDSGQINGALAARSAGSTLKPFTYLLAFQQGASPATIADDLPIEFTTPTGLYRPENYDRKCYGPVRYREALANSLNISAVRVLERIGGPKVLHSLLQSLGLTTLTEPPEHFGLGLTLGNAEVPLLELANAYACLARLGQWQPTTCLAPGAKTNPASPEDAAPEHWGETWSSRSTDYPKTMLFDRAACWLIADILRDNDARARAFGLNSPLRLPFPVAVKTGTSTDFRDNWCIGYTPEFTVAVWVGNFDRRPMHRVTGVSGAAPLWRDVFSWIERKRGVTWLQPEPTIVEADVDPLTGERLPPAMVRRRPSVREKFSADFAPVTASANRYDELGRVLLSRHYTRWLATADNWLGAQVALRPAGDETVQQPLQIVSPVSGATILLDPDLPNHGGRVRLRANALSPAIHWSSSTLEIEQTANTAFAHLTPGQHRIIATDSTSGERSEALVLVKTL
ncbi:MAG: penicillin-binding protein 1C [Verrucomicrobiales bacterium]